MQLPSVLEDPSFDYPRRFQAGDALIESGHEQYVISKFEDPSFDADGRWMAACALVHRDHEHYVITKFEDPSFDPEGQWAAACALMSRRHEQYLITKFEDRSFYLAGRWAAAYALIIGAHKHYVTTKFEDPSFDCVGRMVAGRSLNRCGHEQYLITKFEDPSFDPDGRWMAACALVHCDHKHYVTTKFEDPSFDCIGRWVASSSLASGRHEQYLITKFEDISLDPHGRTLAASALLETSDDLVVRSVRSRGFPGTLVVPLISMSASGRLLVLCHESRFLSALGDVDPGTCVPDAAYHGLIRLFEERRLPREARRQVKAFFRRHLHFNDRGSDAFMRELLIFRSYHPAADSRKRYRHEIANRVVQDPVLCRILGSMPHMHKNRFVHCQEELLFKLEEDVRCLADPAQLSQSYTVLWRQLQTICKAMRRRERTTARVTTFTDLFHGAKDCDDLSQELVVSPFGLPEEYAHWHSCMRALAELSETLPSFRRDLLRLHFLEGLSYRKIAQLVPELRDRSLEAGQRMAGREVKRALAQLRPTLKAYRDISLPRVTTRRAEHSNGRPPRCSE
jgi:hypothetical protein